jgi:hypothetical protein
MLSEPGGVTAHGLLDWLKKIDKLIKVATSFNDRTKHEHLQKHLETMNDMYKILTGDATPQEQRGARELSGLDADRTI